MAATAAAAAWRRSSARRQAPQAAQCGSSAALLSCITTLRTLTWGATPASSPGRVVHALTQSPTPPSPSLSPGGGLTPRVLTRCDLRLLAIAEQLRRAGHPLLFVGADDTDPGGVGRAELQRRGATVVAPLPSAAALVRLATQHDAAVVVRTLSALNYDPDRFLPRTPTGTRSETGTGIPFYPATTT